LQWQAQYFQSFAELRFPRGLDRREQAEEERILNG